MQQKLIQIIFDKFDHKSSFQLLFLGDLKAQKYLKKILKKYKKKKKRNFEVINLQFKQTFL